MRSTRLDRVPRLTIDIGARRLPVFRTVGFVAYEVALLILIGGALAADMPLVTALAIATVAPTAFFAWSLARRALTGSEKFVAFEQVWVTGLSVVALLLLTYPGSHPVVAGSDRIVDRTTWLSAGLDLYCVALAAFLAVGRLGCLAVGCCHGAPAAAGITYPRGHPVPSHLVGRPLVPVQLIESIGTAIIGVIGLLLLLHRPGTSTVWFLGSVAALRFGTEALRGDRRATWRGVSLHRVAFGGQLLVAVVLAEAWLTDGSLGDRIRGDGEWSTGLLIAGGIVLIGTASGLTALARRPRRPLLGSEHVAEVWELLATTPVSPEEHAPTAVVTSGGMSVAVSAVDGGRLVSFSHPTEPTLGIALTIAVEPVHEGRDMCWFVLTDHDPRCCGMVRMDDLRSMTSDAGRTAANGLQPDVPRPPIADGARPPIADGARPPIADGARPNRRPTSYFGGPSTVPSS